MTQLSTGHVVQVLKVGTRAGYPAHTLHLIAFVLAGKVVHVEDFETQWNAPHPDPGSRITRILEQYASHMSGGSLLPDDHWSDAPDTHGNLAHPSMAPLRPVTP
jgi:hypothetical protein